MATSVAVSPVEPAVRSREPDEREAATAQARRLDDLVLGCWVGALRDGILSVPGRPPVEVPAAAGAFDLIGVSYDHASAVYADGSTGPYPTDARVGPTGHAPWPEGLGLSLRRLADALPGRPLLVTGTGVATPADDPSQDEWRVAVLRETAGQIARARADGVDVRGVFHRTAVDGYEWRHGFGVHRGLFDRDRRPKPSAAVVAELAAPGP